MNIGTMPIDIGIVISSIGRVAMFESRSVITSSAGDGIRRHDVH